MIKYALKTFIVFFMLGNTIAQAEELDVFHYYIGDMEKTYRKATHQWLTPTQILNGDANGGDLIVNIYSHLLCSPNDSLSACPRLAGYQNVRSDINAQIDRAMTWISNKGLQDQVKVWHIIDEPYLKNKQTSREDISYAISRLYWRSVANGYDTNIPRWVNFAHDCFKCSNNRSPFCAVQYEVSNTEHYCRAPGNATRLSLDWYNHSTARANNKVNCGNGTVDCHADEHVSQTISPTLADLKVSKFSYQDIVLIPGVHMNVSGKRISAVGGNEAVARYADLALADDEIKGVIPYLYKTPPNADIQTTIDGEPAYKAVDKMENGVESERFYQALANELGKGIQDSNYIAVFEYNDDKEFTKSSGEISPADSHYYTMGYEGAETGVYAIRRLAFYTRPNADGIYTRPVYRCAIPRPNSRSVILFSKTSNCSGVSTATLTDMVYVSPIRQGEADHMVINCRSSIAPYWDQGWTMVPPNGYPAHECTNVFGSDYIHFGTLGYSKQF